MRKEILMDHKIMQLQRLLNESNHTVVVTGAGVSMSSGIMDMEHMNVFQTMQTSLEVLVKARPEHSYKLLEKSFLKGMFEIGPTITHKKLTELETKGKVQGIITTNIDCLHKISGSNNVAEIQGSYGINRCMKCGKQYDDVKIWNTGKAPRCQSCNGVILSHPVYSHVGIYESDYQKANDWMSRTELVLIVGSKGMYGTYFNRRKQGTRLVQINPQSTQFDDVVDLNIVKESDEVFELLS